jgi:hypothetical protein
MEIGEFKIVKDWLYGRKPRWFEQYGSREGPATEEGSEDRWTVRPFDMPTYVDAWKSRYCHHLCRLWIHGSCFGPDFQQEVTKRLAKLTLSDPRKGKQSFTADEPDWTSKFVLARSTLRLMYDSPGIHCVPLNKWASRVVASRLDMRELYIFCLNDLPIDFISNLYQSKLRLEAETHYEECGELETLRRELKSQVAAHKQVRRELVDEVEYQLNQCLRAVCLPGKHRSCGFHKYRAGLSK